MDGTLRCARCDYDLRMLEVGGLCPECALPIRHSVEAAARPLPLDPRAMRRATAVLLTSAAVRLVVALLVAGREFLYGHPGLVWSVLRDILRRWPIRPATYCIQALTSGRFARNLGWVALVVLFVAAFALEVAGVALLTLRPRSRRRGADLRRATGGLAAASVVIWALLLLLGSSQPRLPSLFWHVFVDILPPVAVAAWSGYLLKVARGSDWCRRYAWPAAVVAAAICGTLANWPSSFEDSNWLLSGAAVVSFGALSAMWLNLFRLARPLEVAPAPPGSDTIA